MKEQFIAAIQTKSKIKVAFFSKEDGRNLTRLCAPMDFGPSRRASDQSDRFHMWDYESDKMSHTLSLLPDQMVAIDVSAEHFDPAEFVTWKTDWFIRRNWGQYS